MFENQGMKDIREIGFSSARLDALELKVSGISNLLSGLTISGLLADIELGTPGVNSRSDKITKKRKNCNVIVTADVGYEFQSSRTQGDKTCITYKITTRITVAEVCDPASDSRPAKAASHISKKEFCAGDGGDVPKTGETEDFNGDSTDTLTYPHGTKVTVKKSGDTITVSVTFPDGTSVSTTLS